MPNKKDKPLLSFSSYVQGNRGRTVVLLLLSLITSCQAVTLAWYTKELIDSAVRGSMEALIHTGLGYLLWFVLFLGIDILRNILMETGQARLENSMKQETIHTILHSRFSDIARFENGDLLTRLNDDVQTIASAWVKLLPFIVAILLSLLWAGVALLLLDVRILFVALGIGIVSALFVNVVKPIVKRMYAETRERAGKSQTITLELIEKLMIIKAFTREATFFKQVKARYDRVLEATVKRRLFGVFTSSLMDFFFRASNFFFLVWGAVSIVQHRYTYGTLMAVLQLVTQVLAPFNYTTSFIPFLFEMSAAKKRVGDLLTLPRDQLHPSPLLTQFEAISIDHVSFAIDGRMILQTQRHVIRREEKIAVVGESGAGKTTFFKMLIGIHIPQSGAMTLMLPGQETLPISDSTRGLFSYVAQKNALFSGTIRENVSFFDTEMPEEVVVSALKNACLYSHIQTLPQGLDTVLTGDGNELSHGQAQRLAIARALATQRPVLLLDEATSALDAQTEQQVLRNILSIKGLTVLFISHRDVARQYCDRILDIQDGQMLG